MTFSKIFSQRESNFHLHRTARVDFAIKKYSKRIAKPSTDLKLDQSKLNANGNLNSISIGIFIGKPIFLAIQHIVSKKSYVK